MKTRMFVVALSFLLLAVNAFGADGDLIVGGKLGVGTTAPQYPLHVQSNPSAEAIRIYGRNNGGVDEANLGFFSYSGAMHGWIQGISGRLDLYGGSINTMTVANGNVGIGTTNPGAKLDILGYSQSSPSLSVRAANTGNSIEWGHANGAGYGSTIGYNVGGGQPFIAFNAEAGSTSNTFRTRGIKGRVIQADLGGGLVFSRVDTANADNQYPTGDFVVAWNGYVGIGTTTPSYNLHVNGTAYCLNGYWSGSDERWKKNIAPLTDSLANVLKLQGKSYEWNQEAASTEVASTGTTSDSVVNADGSPVAKPAPPHFEEGRQIGLIAQEVEAVFPELVRTDEKGFKAISYDKLTVVLIEAIKELQKEIEALKAAQTQK